jgi:tetratricopeptide (TPR) repeat protein/transglutaminase-like putative cysteine protease
MAHDLGLGRSCATTLGPEILAMHAPNSPRIARQARESASVKRCHGHRRPKRTAIAATIVSLALGFQPLSADAKPDSRRAVSTKSGAHGPVMRRFFDLMQGLKQRKSRDPAAIADLLNLLPHYAGEATPDQIGDVLARAKSAAMHPVVRAHASYLEAWLAERTGSREQALATYRELGFLLDWQVIGPFDHAARRGHDTVYPPERDSFSADRSYPGKLAGIAVNWRNFVASDSSAGAYVDLGAILRPTMDVVGYARAWIEVPPSKARNAGANSQRLALHLGTGGPYRVWVNGKIYGESEIDRVPHPLQDSMEIEVHPGFNEILIKVAASDHPWGFYARISQLDGSPWPALKAGARPPATAAHATKSIAAGGPAKPERASSTSSNAFSLGQSLERSVAARPTLQAMQDYLTYLRQVHPLDKNDAGARELAARIHEEYPSASSALTMAEVTDSQSDVRSLLELAVQRAQAEGPRANDVRAAALRDLAMRELGLSQRERAQAHVEEALRLVPDDARARLIELEMIGRQGLDLLALRELQSLVDNDTRQAALYRVLATRLHDLGRSQEALQVIDKLAALHDERDDGQELKVEILLQLGRFHEARALTLAQSLAQPSDAQVRTRLADVESRAGDLLAATSALREAVDLAPHDADLWRELGDRSAQAGLRHEAVAAYNRSLDLLPQQPDLRDRLHELSGPSEMDWAARHEVDFKEVLAKAPQSRASWRDRSAVILRQNLAIRVLPNGLTERLDQRIIRILDERGAREFSTQGMSCDPEVSYVEVRKSRIADREGHIREAGTNSTYSMTEAGYRMFYDQRRTVVEWGAIEPGDTIEVIFVQRDIAQRNYFDVYFGDVVFLQNQIPIESISYLVETPLSLPLYFNLPMFRQVDQKAGTQKYSLKRANVPAVLGEPGMPGPAESAAYLHASTYAKWEDVGKWYAALAKPQLIVDESVRQAVQEALSGIAADAPVRAKIDAIYNFVVRKTRYIGLEFGIHGFKPYRTTEVLDRRFGDCKDKASLLKVMLGEIGVKANLVLLRTRDLGKLGEKPASLSGFNHAITYLPEHDLYLDGTAEFSASHELPVLDHGASVLIVDDEKGGEYRITPLGAPQDNTTTMTTTVKLKTSGDAEVDLRLDVVGSGAGRWRQRLFSEQERKQRLTEDLSTVFAQGKVVQSKVEGATELGKSVVIGAEIEVPKLAQVQGRALRIPALGITHELTRSLAPLTERKEPVRPSEPRTQAFKMTLVAPTGWRIAQVPADKELVSSFGKLALIIRSSGAKAEVECTITHRGEDIAVEDYSAYREFLRGIDLSLAQTFELVPATTISR